MATSILLPLALVAASTHSPAMRAVIFGGGPSPELNQAAIERHVRFVDGLLPPQVERRILFASGSPDDATVQLLEGRRIRYVTPKLSRIDGPITDAGIDDVWRGFVTAQPDDPFLFYFAGHGTPNGKSGLDDNRFDLWGGGGLSVRELADRIAELPPTTPVTVVMAQCYSGSFANLLFEDGDPSEPLVERDIVGFFAATAQLPASGCTPDVNEADYQDFSSYFFGALGGRDRLGRPVRGADFDRNGRVGMDEAFAFALIAQDSEDVPVATSDAFLRRFVRQPDGETMATPYSAVLSWARPAQRAALVGLSKRLGLHGEGRLRETYDAYFRRRGRLAPDAALRLRFVRLAKSVVLGHVLEEQGSPALIQRWERLLAAEAQNPLVP